MGQPLLGRGERHFFFFNQRVGIVIQLTGIYLAITSCIWKLFNNQPSIIHFIALAKYKAAEVKNQNVESPHRIGWRTYTRKMSVEQEGNMYLI